MFTGEKNRLPIEHVTERVEQIMGRGYGGSILVHVGTNNTDKEGTTAILEKYRNLLKKTVLHQVHAFPFQHLVLY